MSKYYSKILDYYNVEENIKGLNTLKVKDTDYTIIKESIKKTTILVDISGNIYWTKSLKKIYITPEQYDENDSPERVLHMVSALISNNIIRDTTNKVSINDIEYSIIMETNIILLYLNGKLYWIESNEELNKWIESNEELEDINYEITEEMLSRKVSKDMLIYADVQELINDLYREVSTKGGKRTATAAPAYKLNGEKVSLLINKKKLHRSVYVKGTGKAKYCKINYEFVLLSKLKNKIL
jgi:hypothetical protein